MTKQKPWPVFSKPFRWWLYIPIVLLSIIAISVVSCFVMHSHSSSTQGANKMSFDYSGLPVKTQVPVIGILSQVLRDYKRFVKDHHLHIAASYVKWIEAAGAQVVPILLNQNDHYYETMFKQTNGILFPGGDNLLDPNKDTPMMVAAKKMYKLAVDANRRGDYYPIWGTCLGLELLSVLSSNMYVLESCSAIDQVYPMEFVQRGKLFAPASYSNIPQLNQDYSGVMVEVLTNNNLSYHYHRKCLTDEGLEKAGLKNFYRPLAYSSDKYNQKFISIMEAIEFPFYSVQFHPEKASFEFVTKSKQHHIPHSREAIAVSRYFADFFVQQAQRNGHVVTRDLIDKFLIYADKPSYTALQNDMYEQRFFFPFGSDIGAGSTEEFLDHIPGEDEHVNEDVTTTEHHHDQLNGGQSGKLIVSPPVQQGDFYVVEN